MQTNDDWHSDITKKIGGYKDRFSKKEYKKYKLDLLLRAADRVAGFSADCAECERLQGEITILVEGMSDSTEQSKEQRKSHLKGISTVVKHLQKSHKLICEGDYALLGLTIGITIGVAIGAWTNKVHIWVPIGVGVGLAIGSVRRRKPRRTEK